MAVPDRTLNTLLKDIVLKSAIVIYTDQSPTKNKEVAIQKMLEAGEFIANYGMTMDQESFDRLGKLSVKLVQSQRLVSTGWRNLLAHPLVTYKSARDLKAGADKLLSEAKSASFRSKVNQVSMAREERAAERGVLRRHVAPSAEAEGAVLATAHPENVAAPATQSPPALPHTNFGTVVGDDRAYIRLGELEMRIPLDSRTRIGFDGEVLTTRFCTGPIRPRASPPNDQQVGAVKRTASVFTATGTARIVTIPQTDPPSRDASENHDEEVPTTCKFEWLEGPIVTALTDLEGGEPETMPDGGSDSGASSD